jgi:ATP-dependent DNA helicase RecG
MTLESSVTDLKGIGEAVARKFAVLGLKTVEDLIDNYPRRYEDYSEVTPVNRLRPGLVTIQVMIEKTTGRYVKRGMHITEAVAADETGSVRLLWFNQPYRAAGLKTTELYFVSGLFELSHGRLVIMNPSIELVTDFIVNAARILPIYRETKGLTSRQIRAALYQVLPLVQALPETLPAHIIKHQRLVSRAQAMTSMHFPDSSKDIEVAHRRLGFEEVFSLSLAALLNKQANQKEKALPVPFNQTLAQEFVSHLPFTLTDAQRKVIWQTYIDMQKSEPMNRLIEGDVGSGKTVVATMAALMVMQADWQVALMAPTELLARQHAETIYKLLQPIGLADQVGLLVGSLPAAQKKRAQEAISSGQTRFMIGTQALIQEKVNMEKLALVIIDEQHRFGVDQRKTLQAKAGHMPHVLSMTATPIPRSLALTLYGELDISVIADKPIGRLPIVTQVESPNSRPQLYKHIDAELETGRQLFVVCPVITDSETLDVKSAESVYQDLQKTVFKHRRIGLLHGKLKPAEKVQVMQDFVDKKLDILVATTVIEVGVDVPNATIMLIESAERFGLAQLHQLRGRVGRSHHQGYCYLMLSDSKPPSRRLRALESSGDGFKLAELDLELRGPGAIYGQMQHGQLDLRIAKLSDTKLIAAARAEAQAIIDSGEDLLEYKHLMQHVNRLRAVTNLN